MAGRARQSRHAARAARGGADPVGLALRGSALQLDPRGRPALGFLSHARETRTQLPERLIATAGTLALLESNTPRLLEQTAPLPANFGSPFTLGPLRLNLKPAGHVRGSAFLEESSRTAG